MRTLLTLLLLLPLTAHSQAIWRNFFVTNQNPRVTVVAGSNATVQASLVGVDQRIFTVNAIPGGTVNTNDLNGWLSTNAAGFAGYATNAGFATNATYALWGTNSFFVLTAILTNQLYGSNIVGAVPEATHATNADNASNSTNFWGVLAPTNLPPGLATSNYVGTFTGNGAGLTNLSQGAYTGTVTNTINSTNVTLTGPVQIYGTSDRTNGIYIDSSGEVLSNASGGVTLAGGNVTGSGLSKFTNGFASGVFTVATLPTGPVVSQQVWASDVLTSRGTGDICLYDGADWRTRENAVATTDLRVFVFGSLSAGIISMNKKSVIINDQSPLTASSLVSSLNMIQAGASGGGSTITHVAPPVYQWSYGPSVALAAGTTSTGAAYIYGMQQGFNRSSETNDLLACGAAVSVGNVCDQTETYWVVASGITGAAALTAYPTTGAFFLYDMYNATGHGQTGTITNNWICVTCNSSTYAFSDSGLSPQLSTGPTNRLAVILQNSGAYFYTNGVLCGALLSSSATPTNSTLNVCQNGIKKTAGSTSRSLYVASFWTHVRRGTPATIP